MGLNPGIYHYMMKGNHDEPDKINIYGIENTSTNNEKLFCVPTDKKLSFDIHIKSLCKNVVQKRSAHSRISSYLTLDPTLLLINSVLKSQFTY